MRLRCRIIWTDLLNLNSRKGALEGRQDGDADRSSCWAADTVAKSPNLNSIFG